MLYGYGSVIATGTMMTAVLMLLSIALATLIGVGGAVCKISKNPILRILATLYTTVIRSVPDLVLMLLIFYNIQIVVNHICVWLGFERIEIDAFTAGVATLAMIYGAYMTETFRGGMEAVPEGQIEAAFSTGMTSWSVFRLVTLPLMVKYAIPSYSNNIQVVMKATALVSILGLVDIVSVSQQVGNASRRTFFFSIVAAAVYLAFTSVALMALRAIDKRVNVGVTRT